MATHRTNAAFIKAFDKRIENLTHNMESIHRELVNGGIEDHNDLTKGTLSTKQLRKDGHPFARQNGGGRGVVGKGARKGIKKSRPVLPINKQTGKLRNSFYKVSTKTLFGGRSDKMGFRAYYARFVLRPGGTRKMIDRGFYSISGKPGVIRRRHRTRLQIVRKRLTTKRKN